MFAALSFSVNSSYTYSRGLALTCNPKNGFHLILMLY